MEKPDRPTIKLPYTGVEKTFELVAAAGLLLSIFLIINYWTSLPDEVPSHFGMSGKPDAWSGKGLLIVLPLVSLFLYALFTIVSRFPQYANYLIKITEQNVERQYRMARQFMAILKAELIWVFTLINWASIAVALGRCEGLGVLFLPIFLVIVFGTIGIYIYKSVKAA
ncbi:MAG: DUF1648 domain-containing protein [Candidatus Zixiibacteriota bacterium]